MTDLEKALDIAERITKYTLYKSMNQLRSRIKHHLKVEGLEDQLRNFKLKQSGNNEVMVYIRPGIELDSSVVDRFKNNP